MSFMEWISLITLVATVCGGIFVIGMRHALQDVKSLTALSTRLEAAEKILTESRAAAIDGRDILSRLASIEKEIGDHESGLRGDNHRQNGMLGRHNGVIYFLCKKVGINSDIIRVLENPPL